MDEYELNKLLTKINELEAELDIAKKYGLVWDKEKTPENAALKEITSIPFLEEKGLSIIKDDDVNHILIEGDNYHILTALRMADINNIDIIYIDPPYNTGHEDFIYNDKFVGEDDGYRHSKWLSFMEKRLTLARDLLNEYGAIFISIDEHEFAQLKLLCDSIFGESNFIENFIWIKNVTKNLSKTVSTNHEYVLCYAKQISKIQERGGFRVKKDGVDEAIAYVNKCKEKGMTYKEAEVALRDLYKKDNKFDGISLYCYVDKNFRIFTSDNPSAPIASGTSRNNFDIIHPVTHKPCKKTNRGWAFNEEKLKEYLANDMLIFGEDETKIPRVKRFLDTVKDMVQISYIVDNTDGKKELQRIFGSNSVFENPKPTTLIKRFIKLYGPKATILDFFAGSGTTGDSVLQLNNEDGGSRKFILCTNNENGICENITYERLKTVLTGNRKDGSSYSDGFKGNLIYYKTSFVDDQKNTDSAKYTLVEKCNALLSIIEDCYVLEKSNTCWFHYKNKNKHLFIYNDFYSKASFDDMKNYMNLINGEKVLYAFSTDGNLDLIDQSGLDSVVIKPIPSKIYETYKEIVENIKRGK